MKRQISNPSALRNACHSLRAVAAAAVFALALAPLAAHAAPLPAMESSGVYVTILSPNPGAAFDGDGKQIEVSAFYQAPLTTGGVSVLELYIDGTKQADKKLDSPETRGVVSFLISPGTLTPGAHQIVVRVSAMDAEVASARTSLSLKGEAVNTQGEAIPLTAPHVFIASPAPEATVSGTVAIKVNANDDSGKPPYVSLFVDHAFKTLRNYPPFDFEWDTTHVSNGYHTIEVWGYNDAQMVGHAEPLRVLVNNPGGRTLMRHDLSDTVARPSAPPKPSALKVALKPQPTKAHHTAAAPVLASSRASVVTSVPQRLAEASLSGTQVDASTSLMAPFLGLDAHAAPGAEPVAPAKTVLAARPTRKIAAHKTVDRAGAPKLAVSSPAAPAAPLQLAAGGSPDASDLTTDTQLAAPFLRPVAPGHAANSITPSRTAQAQAAPVNPAAIAAPKIAPALSAQAPTTLKIASATASASDLFSGESALQAPAFPGTHPLAAHAARPLPVTSVAVSSERMLLRARGSYQVVYNDRLVALDKPLAERSSILFAPFRQIFESSGGSLAWLSGTKTVHAVSPTKDIELTIGSRDALINNQTQRLTISPYLQTGRTMVPLSFLPLALDVTVNFDPITGHVVINSKD